MPLNRAKVSLNLKFVYFSSSGIKYFLQKMKKTAAIAFKVMGIILLTQALRPAYIACKNDLSWDQYALMVLISLFVFNYSR